MNQEIIWRLERNLNCSFVSDNMKEGSKWWRRKRSSVLVLIVCSLSQLTGRTTYEREPRIDFSMFLRFLRFFGPLRKADEQHSSGWSLSEVCQMEEEK
jgi:hypothetical protein